MGFKVKPLGLAFGLVGCALIVVSIHAVVGTGSCGGYRAACPDSLTPYVILLPVGIVTSVIAIAFGGGAWTFLGIFLSVGVGSLWAATEATEAAEAMFGYVFGGAFAGLPLLFGLAWALMAGRGAQRAAKAQQLIATGAQGVGTVTSVQDTGVTINGNPRVRITMRVEPADRSAPFEATKAVTVPRVAIPRSGERYPVWYDRNDPTTWAYGTDLDASAASQEVRAAFARAGRNGPPSSTGSPPLGLAAQLAQLAELHRTGDLSDVEFAAAKDRLLGGHPN